MMVSWVFETTWELIHHKKNGGGGPQRAEDAGEGGVCVFRVRGLTRARVCDYISHLAGTAHPLRSLPPAQ